MPTWFINGEPFTQYFNADGSPIVGDATVASTYMLIFNVPRMKYQKFVCVKALVCCYWTLHCLRHFKSMHSLKHLAADAGQAI